MLGAYQLDRARRNFTGYAVLGKDGCRCDRGLGQYVAPPAWSTTPTPGSSVTADQALNQAEAGLSSPDFPNPDWWGYALQDIANFQMTLDATCASAPQASPLSLVKTAGGLGLQVTSAVASIGAQAGTAAAMAVAQAVPIVGAVFSTIVGIFSIISAHHAQAVQQEQALQCSLVPAANNYLTVIAQGVQSGAATPAEAMAALDSLVSDFMSEAQPSFRTNPCNAMCEWSVVLSAIRNYWKAQFAAVVAGTQAAAEAPAGSGSGIAIAPPGAAPIAATSPSTAIATSPAGQPVAAPIAAPSMTWIFLGAAALLGFALSEVL